MTRDDISSLAHSKWNCKYHIVFAPKYRRIVIYKQIKTDIGRILRKLCEQKGAEDTMLIQWERIKSELKNIYATNCKRT